MMGNSTGNIQQMIEKLKKQYPGDPNQYIQQLLNSGRISQAQYNNAVQRAQQIQRMMGKN
jgi:hypothetical protein